MVKTIIADDESLEALSIETPRLPYSVSFSDIGTLVPNCACASEGEVSSALLESLELQGFDQAPVHTTASPVGCRLVSYATLKELHASGQILASSSYEPDDTHCIESVHISLVALLRLFVGRRAALVYVEEEYDASEILDEGISSLSASYSEQTLLGLVTISDLNRRAVRAAAYELLLDLETLLGKLIERRFAKDEDWLCKLTEPSQARILGYWELLKRRGIDTKPVERTMLDELLDVVARTPVLRSVIGASSDSEMKGAKHKIKDMRNRVMHPVQPFATGNQDVTKMLSAVEFAVAFQARLASIVEA